MKRSSAGWIVGILLFALTAVFFPAATAGAAPVQDPNACFPGSDADYPPAGNAVQIQASLTLLSAQFNPGATGTIVIGGATPNALYCGNAFSTPIVLPAKQADSQGRLNYNIAVPKDFELGAFHHIDLFKQQVQVGSFDFCVNKTGGLAPNSSCAKGGTPGPLAKTGANSLMEILRIAIVLLGLGAGAYYLKRRRDQGQAAA